MANPEHLAIAKKGREEWNAWREAKPGVRVDLSDINFEKEFGGDGFYDLPYVLGYDFSGCNLSRVIARNSYFEGCIFDNCQINFSDLCFTLFASCTFRGTSMRVTKIGSASFEGCIFENADLAYCTAQETKFTESEIIRSSLNHVRLVQADLTGAVLRETSVYGVSAWDLVLDGAVQRDLLITDEYGEARLTVDSIEVAQFLYLLVHNAKVRDVVDTIVSSVVLILGRFTPDRKPTLDRVKDLLRGCGYLPVLFDFEGPRSRDLTETISILAHLSRFVIADLTDPASVPHELQAIIPALPSVPVQPVILQGREPYALFEHAERYPWVLPIKEYHPDKLEGVVTLIVEECERRVNTEADPTEEGIGQ